MGREATPGPTPHPRGIKFPSSDGSLMRKTMLALLLAVSFSVIGCFNKEKTSLVHINSRDYGDTHSTGQAMELERNGNTSKIKVVFQKRGSSVGDSMFIMMAFYEVAKARNYEYFTNLKEWNDRDGGRIYIAGFTNKKDADIKKEFGEQYNYENKHGQKRGQMSVSQMKTLMEERKRRKIGHH